jgi:hypothetical protein
MKKEARTLTGEQDRMFASAASEKKESSRRRFISIVFQPQETLRKLI